MANVLTIVYWNHGHPDKEATSLNILENDPGLPSVLDFHGHHHEGNSLSITEFFERQGLTLRQARSLVPNAELEPDCPKGPNGELPAEILDNAQWSRVWGRQILPKSGEDLQGLANFLRMPIIGYSRYRSSDQASPEKWFEVQPN